jgi:hypothetical protein
MDGDVFLDAKHKGKHIGHSVHATHACVIITSAPLYIRVRANEREPSLLSIFSYATPTS